MLNVSIVTYKNLWSEIEPLIQTLKKSEVIGQIFIIDNSPVPSCDFNTNDVKYIFTGKNIGYGAAHNIALRKSIQRNIPYHLIVNPDISFNISIINELLQFMEENPNIGHVMPKVLYPDGKTQYLCKLLPTPTDLFIRRFLPDKWTEKRMWIFEMRSSGYSEIMDVPYLSGCFMLLRTEALKQVGLFDERFFLYPEDIDLTRRIGKKFRTVFYPHVTIVHNHKRSSYSSINMMLIHTWNLIKYFNKWGWIFDKKRKRINQELIKLYNL